MAIKLRPHVDPGYDGPDVTLAQLERIVAVLKVFPMLHDAIDEIMAWKMGLNVMWKPCMNDIRPLADRFDILVGACVRIEGWRPEDAEVPFPPRESRLSSIHEGGYEHQVCE